MATGKRIELLGILAMALALVITLMMFGANAMGIEPVQQKIGYEDRLFDNRYVHTIDIQMDDWDAFIDTCRSEEYSLCTVVIDGETLHNVGIRGKGNTSLSSVASMGSERYSFKLEFDQYDSALSYHGLDKLSLNNLIQDNTMMKDYLTYQMMNEFGAAAPLTSYVYITVNGEDWGLYLAVEAVEESFLKRNYGAEYGDLYKPDSMQMGGGRGNGRDFDMNDFMENAGDEGFTRPQSSRGDKDAEASDAPEADAQGGATMQIPEGFGGMEGMPAMPENFGDFADMFGGMEGMPAMPGGFGGMSEMPGRPDAGAEGETDRKSGDFGKMFGGFGMGSGDVKLQYIDDDIDSYSTIFSSAKTVSNTADQQRLIAALKALSGDDPASAVDVEAVLRYFVVHNYVVNGDSYTGSMVHNYYLYEEDGKLSMIPWDYNLAYGTFMGGNGTSSINDDIDYPLSISGNDRPMYDWIIKNEAYNEQYHELFAQFLDTVDAQSIIAQAEALITPYVAKDPTGFCTFEEYELALETMKTFCALRSESIEKQLAGEEANVSAGDLNLSAMGSMGGGMGGGFGGFDRGQSKPSAEEETEPTAPETVAPDARAGATMQFDPSAGFLQGDMNGFDPTQGGMSNFPQEDMNGFAPMQGGMSNFPQEDMNGFDPTQGGMGGFPQRGDMSGFKPSAGGFPQGSMSAAESDTQTESQPKKDSTARPYLGGDRGGFDMSMQQQTQRAGSGLTWAVTLIVLAAGMIFAITFER